MTAARRLVAILAVDIVGRSRLMGEAGTARPTRMRARWTRRRPRWPSPSPQSRNHDQMDEGTSPSVPAVFDGLRKAGLPEE